MYKLKHNSRNLLIEYIIPIFAFIIPLHKILLSPSILLLLVLSITQIAHKNYNWRNILISVSYYLVLIAGLFYSNNTEKGFFELEINASFLAFPLIFSFIGDIPKKTLEKTKKYFIEGVLLSIIGCIAISIYNFFFSTSGINSFLYDQISHFHHTSYASMFTCFGIILVFSQLYNQNKLESNKDAIKWVTLLIFNIYVLLLLSKTGILSMILINIIGCISIIKKHQISRTKISIAGLSIVIFISFSLLVPKVQERLSELNPFSLAQDNQNLTSSSTSRFKTWETSWSVFKTAPIIGVGTGDFDDEMRKKYYEIGAAEIASKSLNAHNQFLQIMARNGIVGLCVFLFLFFDTGIKRKDIITYSFLALILFNCTTESIFQTQSGIVFGTFFLFLFRFTNQNSTSQN